MKKLVQWHKDILNAVADRLGLSAYQVVWISFAKGLVFGCIIGAVWL